jgi:hypothetical protein
VPRRIQVRTLALHSGSARAWFWFVVNPHRDGAAIGAATTEAEAIREAWVTIEKMSARTDRGRDDRLDDLRSNTRAGVLRDHEGTGASQRHAGFRNRVIGGRNENCKTATSPGPGQNSCSARDFFSRQASRNARTRAASRNSISVAQVAAIIRYASDANSARFGSWGLALLGLRSGHSRSAAMNRL